MADIIENVQREVGKLLRILGVKPKVSYWTKYHEMYLKGEFNLENKKQFLEEYFLESVGYFPNIEKPTTINEKIQWYKLYYNDPLIAKCIDKVTFKDYIKEVLGSEYIIPTLGAYSNAEEIDFDKLPDQFVIKANFGSSAKEVIIVADKSKLDIAKTRNTISSWEKPWWRSAWGGYEFVNPKILIEEYIEQENGQVYDYKFMCFNGDPKFIIVHIDRFTRRTVDIYDLNWEKMEITYSDPPNSKGKIDRPKNFPQMLEVSKKLSKRFPLVRVDFYEAKGRLYVGELTFYPDGGMSKYHPEKWDRIFGDMLVLPDKKI